MDRDDFFEKWGILANDHNQYHPEYREKIKQNFMEALDSVIEDTDDVTKEKKKMFKKIKKLTKRFFKWIAKGAEKHPPHCGSCGGKK